MSFNACQYSKSPGLYALYYATTPFDLFSGRLHSPLSYTHRPLFCLIIGRNVFQPKNNFPINKFVCKFLLTPPTAPKKRCNLPKQPLLAICNSRTSSGLSAGVIAVGPGYKGRMHGASGDGEPVGSDDPRPRAVRSGPLGSRAPRNRSRPRQAVRYRALQAVRACNLSARQMD
jgi:hypothetical protein